MCHHCVRIQPQGENSHLHFLTNVRSTKEKGWLVFSWRLTLLLPWERAGEGSGCVINPVLPCQRADNIALLRVWGHHPIAQWFHSNACSMAFSNNLIYSPELSLPVTSHLCCRFPCFILSFRDCPFFNSSYFRLVSSLFELVPPLFSAISLSCHRLKVNEADLLPGENSLWGRSIAWESWLSFFCVYGMSHF